jgi:hypothetical protein
MNVYCDNYKTCNGVVMDWSNDRPSDDMLRARGWRSWQGESLTGAPLVVLLCNKCVKSTRPVPAEVLEGQQELFDV